MLHMTEPLPSALFLNLCSVGQIISMHTMDTHPIIISTLLWCTAFTSSYHSALCVVSRDLGLPSSCETPPRGLNKNIG